MKAASKLANESLLDQIANAYVEEATRMKKEMGYDKGGTKKPTGPKAKDAALDAIKAKYKGQIMRTGSKQEKKVKGAKPSGGGKFQMMAIKKKETETAAKKAGYKNTQDYVNVQAVRKGGLGTQCIYRSGSNTFITMFSFLLPLASKIISDAVDKIPEDAELGEKLIDICLKIIGKAVKLTKTDADDKLFAQVEAAIKSRQHNVTDTTGHPWYFYKYLKTNYYKKRNGSLGNK